MKKELLLAIQSLEQSFLSICWIRTMCNYLAAAVAMSKMNIEFQQIWQYLIMYISIKKQKSVVKSRIAQYMLHTDLLNGVHHTHAVQDNLERDIQAISTIQFFHQNRMSGYQTKEHKEFKYKRLKNFKQKQIFLLLFPITTSTWAEEYIM